MLGTIPLVTTRPLTRDWRISIAGGRQWKISSDVWKVTPPVRLRTSAVSG